MICVPKADQSAPTQGLQTHLTADMDENVFWIWNKWGLLFLGGIAIWQFLHIAVTIFVRSLYQLRSPLAVFIGAPSIVLGFVLSGWVVSLLNVIVGMGIGITFAKMMMIFREEK